MENLLTGCDCRDACYKCLKHYRNQFVHGVLDRFAALELLKWGKSGVLTKRFTIQQQQRYLSPLKDILNLSGCKVEFGKEDTTATKKGREKHIEIYPSMWAEPKKNGTIFVSEALIKYAKPYAVKRIMDEMKY